MQQKRNLLKNKTLIVGCGRLGISIANKCSEEGKNIMAVDINEDCFDSLSSKFSGYTFVGDVTDLSVLEEANIASAKEVIITTGDDNINLFVALVARKMYDVPNIYVRLDDPSAAVLIQGLKIKAIYPFELSFDKFNLIRGGSK